MSAPVAVRGGLWPGAGREALVDHVVVIDRGVVMQIAPYADSIVTEVAEVVGSADAWVGPGLYDRHVHLAFASADAVVAGGVLQARDLGAPSASTVAADAQSCGLTVLSAGQLLTAPGGYPSRTWGADGFASFAASPDDAVRQVVEARDRGVDVIKVAVEDADGQLPLLPEVLTAAVRVAHDNGLEVVAHALSVAMVHRALDAGVDEFAHTPTELLPDEVVQRISEAGVSVCSTLQTFFAEGQGEQAAKNAAALIEHGVPVHYATDLGNAGTHPGVDPRELDRLARAGLGRVGALEAASIEPIAVGSPARLVVLPEDPIAEPAVWRTPIAVVSGERIIRG